MNMLRRWFQLWLRVPDFDYVVKARAQSDARHFEAVRQQNTQTVNHIMEYMNQQVLSGLRDQMAMSALRVLGTTEDSVNKAYEIADAMMSRRQR